MARSSPQTFQKRQRERKLQEKADAKFERRQWRAEEKRLAKQEREENGGEKPNNYAPDPKPGDMDEPYPND